MLLIFLVFCVVLCFCVFWLPSSCVPNVASVSGLSLRFSLTFFLSCVLHAQFASVSGLSILVCPFSFLQGLFVMWFVYPMFQCLWIVHSCLPLQFSPRFICHVFCVSNVASVSRLPVLVCPFSFLQGLFVMCFVYPMLPVSLDCPCLNTPSVFSNFCKVITHILLNVRRYTVKPALVTTSNKLQSNLF